MAVAPTDPNRVYVVSGDTNGFDKGFFVSNDGGDTFQTAGHANNESEYQWWFGRIWVDPGNENHVFVADVSLRQSFDGGQTWSSINGVHADQHTMAWDPGTVSTTDQSAERIYLGNDGGIYHTDSDGIASSSWVHATYEPWNQTYHIAVAADNDNRLATGMQDNGSVRTWTPATPSPTDTSQFNAYGGGDGHYVAIDQTNDAIYYQCSQNGNCGGVQDNSDGTADDAPVRPPPGYRDTVHRGRAPGDRPHQPVSALPWRERARPVDRSRSHVDADQPLGSERPARPAAPRGGAGSGLRQHVRDDLGDSACGDQSRSERAREHDLCRHRHRLPVEDSRRRPDLDAANRAAPALGELDRGGPREREPGLGRVLRVPHRR